MRTELEFSLRFIFDPHEPVKPEEMLMLEGMVELVRKLREHAPHLLPEGKITVLEALKEKVKYVSVLQGKHGVWEERKRVAEEALVASDGSQTRAALSLGIAYNTFRMWLNGGAFGAKKEEVVT